MITPTQFDNMVQLILIQLNSYVAAFAFLYTYLIPWQGKLAHHIPKGYYSWTNKKNFLWQLTQIERRQARIRSIRQRLSKNQISDALDSILSHPGARYHVGKTHDWPEKITQFLQKHMEDPAIKVSKITRKVLQLTVMNNRAFILCFKCIFFQESKKCCT